VEACDRDASVDAFCKVSEQKHTFARLRYTQEGLNVCNGNQIEDSRACENVRCPVFETCARVPLRPERLPVSHDGADHAAIHPQRRAGGRAGSRCAEVGHHAGDLLGAGQASD
jgi:hypothetical protein